MGDSDWNIHAITDETGKVLKDFSVESCEKENCTEKMPATSSEQTEETKLSNYDKIFQKFGDKSFSRSNIDDLFNCGKDKSLKIIKELGERIKETGSGNQKLYCLQPR